KKAPGHPARLRPTPRQQRPGGRSVTFAPRAAPGQGRHVPMSELSQEHREFYHELPHVIEGHLEMLATLTERLHGGPGVRGVGFVETGPDASGTRREDLTDLGRAMLPHVAAIARGCADHLYELEGRSIANASADEDELNDQLYEVARLLAVLAPALQGAVDHPESTQVTWGVHHLVT